MAQKSVTIPGLVRNTQASCMQQPCMLEIIRKCLIVCHGYKKLYKMSVCLKNNL